VFKGAFEALLENQVPAAYYSLECSGSFELIYGSKKMLQTQNVDAVI
jgi:6,7-dimethyl-8-ribityllumazine synthase